MVASPLRTASAPKRHGIRPAFTSNRHRIRFPKNWEARDWHRPLTNSAEQERSVSFHPDGRTLLYAGERDGKWKLYEATIGDADEKYFFTATKIEEKEIPSGDRESFQPRYSPDGKKNCLPVRPG